MVLVNRLAPKCLVREVWNGLATLVGNELDSRSPAFAEDKLRGLTRVG
jgi:hypothetical protein